MPCDHCTDPDGVPCYPEYGLAPHVSFDDQGRLLRGAYLPESEWPDNFTPNPDEPEMGTYHCPKCGDGKPNHATS